MREFYFCFLMMPMLQYSQNKSTINLFVFESANKHIPQTMLFTPERLSISSRLKRCYSHPNVRNGLNLRGVRAKWVHSAIDAGMIKRDQHVVSFYAPHSAALQSRTSQCVCPMSKIRDSSNIMGSQMLIFVHMLCITFLCF